MRGSGFAEAMPRRLYRMRPDRYLEATAASMAALGVANGAIGVATVALYVDGTVGEFALLAAASIVWYLADAALTARALMRAGAPVRAWLR
ncbi:MAG TPA: hypothetical protein VGW10_07070, partial [Solirubrobacteraceae bacterium]|nr:hypothetical protein [Solirubrobacteraceae bacterium]